jgi:DnaJ-class molecular chaperone
MLIRMMVVQGIQS